MATPPNALTASAMQTDMVKMKQYFEALEHKQARNLAEVQLQTLAIENAALRRELQAVQADVAAMLAADAVRHEADRLANQQRAAFSECVITMFTAFETAMRDFTTVLTGVQAAAQAFQHPAGGSFYAQLATINTVVNQLRFDLQRRP